MESFLQSTPFCISKTR